MVGRPADPSSAPPSSTGDRRATRWLLVALALGAGVGLLAELGDFLPGSAVLLVELGGPWLAAGFAAGAWSPSVRTGAVAGALTVVVALGSYYLSKRIIEPQAVITYLLRSARLYLVLALMAGPLFGAAGALWRRRTGWVRPAAVAVVAGTLAGEAIYAATWLNVPVAITAVEASAAVAVPVILLAGRDRIRALALSATVTPIAFLALDLVVHDLLTEWLYGF